MKSTKLSVNKILIAEPNRFSDYLHFHFLSRLHCREAIREFVRIVRGSGEVQLPRQILRLRWSDSMPHREERRRRLHESDLRSEILRRKRFDGNSCIDDGFATVVSRCFQLPINNRVSTTEAEASPDDIEYLCEDGTRRPVTGTPCTWAQRPWQGYMGNADVNTRLATLQRRISEFYEAAKTSSNKAAAAKLWIDDKHVVVSKAQQTLPGEHLTRAQYKDVIERDGSTQTKIR